MVVLLRCTSEGPEQDLHPDRTTLSKGKKMAKDNMAGETPSQERATKQGGADWPKPGEEGFVHPDGTPQAEAQLQQNKQAAADRAAAGSIVHGAPLAIPGDDPEGETAKAVARADKATDTDKETGANVPKPNPAGGQV